MQVSSFSFQPSSKPLTRQTHIKSPRFSSNLEKSITMSKGSIVGFGLASIGMLIGAGITDLYMPVHPGKEVPQSEVTAFEKKLAHEQTVLKERLFLAASLAIPTVLAGSIVFGGDALAALEGSKKPKADETPSTPV